MNAAENLAAAWQERADRATAELGHANTGWALFTPQRISDVLTERTTALRQVAYWRGIGGAR